MDEIGIIFKRYSELSKVKDGETEEAGWDDFWK